MAVYRLSVQTIQRGQGRSVVAAAAYRSGAALADERLAIAYDFRRKEGIEHVEIMAPANTPAVLLDREGLWNAAERADRRKDAVPAQELLVSLPHELNADQRRELVRDFVAESLVKRGMIADFSIHKPDKEGDQRNFHAHILVTTREVGAEGFGKKNPDWNHASFVSDMRNAWARVQNRHLERALGPTAPKVSGKSLVDRGINRTPSPKMGPAVTAMDRRGELTDVKAHRRQVQTKNDKNLAELREVNRSMQPDRTPYVARAVVELEVELKAIHERLIKDRDSLKAAREAIDVPRPQSVKSLQFEATKPAFVARKRAEKRLEWVEARAKERGSRPTDLSRIAAWVTNPLGTLTSTLKRANADLKRVADARREFQSADQSLSKMQSWVRSEKGQAWIANTREPMVKAGIEATKKRRNLERSIKRYDVRITETSDAIKRLAIAKELKVQTVKMPQKMPANERGEAFAKRFARSVSNPAQAAIQTFPPASIHSAIMRVLTPKAAPTITSPTRSRARSPAPEIDLDIDM